MLLSLLALTTTACAVTIPAASLEERQFCHSATYAEFAQARNAFLREGIIPVTPAAYNATPNLIPDFQPRATMSVVYGNKSAELGTTLSTKETIAHPTVSFTAEQNFDPEITKYTLVMADPDAPNPQTPTLSPILHWLVADAQADCIKGQNRREVASYIPPLPFSVAPHRYTFLIYRQPAGYVPTPLRNSSALRVGFPLLEFVTENNLTGPIAGNFFKEGFGNPLSLGSKRSAVESQMKMIRALE